METEQEDVVVEETTEEDNQTNDETNSTSEGEGETAQKPERKPETPEQRRARIKRQYEREFGKEGDKSSQEGSEESSKKEEVDDRYERLELKTEGVTSKREQDVVLQYIREKKLLGKDVDVSTALKSLVVREELAELRKKESVPAPSRRTSGGESNDFKYWVAQAKKGNFPRHDREMMRKLADARIFTK